MGGGATGEGTAVPLSQPVLTLQAREAMWPGLPILKGEWESGFLCDLLCGPNKTHLCGELATGATCSKSVDSSGPCDLS